MSDNLKGKITISRIHRSFSGNFIQIEIEDEKSGINFVRFEISMEDFSEAITGLGACSGTFQISGLENIGKQLENKTEEVTIPYQDYANNEFGREQARKAVIRDCEIEGWKAELSDLTNHHKFVCNQGGNTVQRVSFHRYV